MGLQGPMSTVVRPVPHEVGALLTHQVQSGAICTMAKPPSPERIRLTIAVTPEVHAIFQRMADATGISLGRAMGDWLEDTHEGAEMLAAQLERARQAPRTVLREMQAGLHGLHGELGIVLDNMRKGGPVAGHGTAGGGTRPASGTPPRPVIRGGKSPGKTRSK